MLRNPIVPRATMAMILFQILGRRMIPALLARHAPNITINRILYLEIIPVNLRAPHWEDCNAAHRKVKFIYYFFGAFIYFLYRNVRATNLPGKMA